MSLNDVLKSIRFREKVNFAEYGYTNVSLSLIEMDTPMVDIWAYMAMFKGITHER